MSSRIVGLVTLCLLGIERLGERRRGRVRGSVSITLRNKAGSRARRVYGVTLRGG